MKHIKLYEDFDVDKFLEDQEGQIKGEIEDTIKRGDYVKTYRGSGEVVSIDQNFITIKPVGSPESVIKVPKDKAERISKDEALGSKRASSDVIKNELKTISSGLEEYLQSAIYDNDEGNEMISGGVDRAIEYIEEILIDLLNLINKDPDLIYYSEFIPIVSSVAYLSRIVLDNDDSKETNEKMDAILAKFEEITG